MSISLLKRCYACGHVIYSNQLPTDVNGLNFHGACYSNGWQGIKEKRTPGLDSYVRQHEELSQMASERETEFEEITKEGGYLPWETNEYLAKKNSAKSGESVNKPSVPIQSQTVQLAFIVDVPEQNGS